MVAARSQRPFPCCMTPAGALSFFTLGLRTALWHGKGRSESESTGGYFVLVPFDPCDGLFVPLQ